MASAEDGSRSGSSDVIKVDCRDKFDNVVNFGGQPDVPSKTQYTQRGRGA